MSVLMDDICAARLLLRRSLMFQFEEESGVGRGVEREVSRRGGVGEWAVGLQRHPPMLVVHITYGAALALYSLNLFVTCVRCSVSYVEDLWTAKCLGPLPAVHCSCP